MPGAPRAVVFPSLTWLRTYAAIVDHGGITAAARALGTAQSTVSTHLHQLERQLDAVLVDRSAPRLRLTAPGEVLATEARELLAHASQVVDLVARARRLPVTGVLTVGGTTTVTERLLPRLLRDFLDEHPGVEVDLHVANSAAVVRAVTDGTLPVALVATSADLPHLECTPVGVEEQVVVVAADHPLAGLDADPPLLRTTRTLLREEGSATRTHQLEQCAAWGVPLRLTSTIASTSAIIAAVGQGLGLACLPRAAVQEALDSGRVAEVHVDPAPPRRTITLVRLPTRALTLVEELFVEMITHERTP